MSDFDLRKAADQLHHLADWLKLRADEESPEEPYSHPPELGMRNPCTVYLAISTTGPNPDHGDEVLELCILSDDVSEKPLLNRLVRPKVKRDWGDSECSGLITPDMVFEPPAPTLCELRLNLHRALKGKRLVIWDAPAVRRFLPKQLDDAVEIVCARTAFNAIPGVLAERLGDALAIPRNAVGGVEIDPRALYRCMYTREVWRWTQREAKQP